MFKGVIIGLLSLFSVAALAAPTATNSKEATDEPMSVQDCSVDIYSNTSTDVVNRLAKCTEEELSSDSYINFYIHKMFDQLPDFLNMLRAEYEYLFAAAVVGILFLYLLMTMAANKKGVLGKKSNFVMKTALFMFLGTIVFVNGGMQYSINWVIDKLLINLTLPLSAANNYSIHSRAKTEFLVKTGGNTEAHARRLVDQFTSSTICALEYRQKIFTGYNFDDKNSYLDNEEISCFDDIVSTTPSFFNGSTGRTVGSQAAKYCSSKYGTTLTDCGVVVIPEKYGKLRSSIQIHAPKIEFYTKEWNDYKCSELAKTDKTMAESLCKEWGGSEFVLPTTNKTEDQLFEEAERIEAELITSLKTDLVTEIVVEDHYREISLLNILDQAIFLVWNDKDVTKDSVEGVEKHSNLILNEVKTPVFSNRDAAFGHEEYGNYTVSEHEAAPLGIPRNIEDYRKQLRKKITEAHDNIFHTNYSVWDKIEDPKLILGDYRNQVDKEDFSVDLWLPKSIKESYTVLFMAVAGAKIGADWRVRSIQSKSHITGNKPNLIMKKISGLLTFFLVLLAVTPFILISSVVTFFLGSLIYILTAIIGLFIKAMFVFVTKYKFEGLIESLIRILFNVYLPMSLIFTLIFSHVGMVLLLSILDQTSFFAEADIANNITKSFIYLGLAYYVYLHTFFRLNSFFSKLIAGHFKSNTEGMHAGGETEAQRHVSAQSNNIFENVK